MIFIETSFEVDGKQYKQGIEVSTKEIIANLTDVTDGDLWKRIRYLLRLTLVAYKLKSTP